MFYQFHITFLNQEFESVHEQGFVYSNKGWIGAVKELTAIYGSNLMTIEYLAEFEEFLIRRDLERVKWESEVKDDLPF